MPSKAERTRQYIIEQAAPVLSRTGYVGTSMADLAKALGLTKGALYGNFKDKEDLAMASFNYTIRRVMAPLNQAVELEKDALPKLSAITNYYRTYYKKIMVGLGGCMLLSVTVDSQYHNPRLFARVMDVAAKLKQGIQNILEAGVASGEFKADLDCPRLAGRIYGQIQGGILLSASFQEGSYLTDMMDHLDDMIEREIVA
ncbi:MAG: TetR/AcrR family transcriptional regulator [Bacteroidota bacterium]